MINFKNTGYIVLAMLYATLAHADPKYVRTPVAPYLMYTESRALVIGASVYNEGSGWPTLIKVPNQVERVSSALRDEGFTVEIVTDPTSDVLSKKLRQFLLKKMDRNARVLVYFAGHGWSDGDAAGYIVPIDSPSENDENFLPSLINMEEIVGWGRRSKAKHVLFVFDSCFSGSIFLVRKNMAPSTSELFLSDIDRKGRQYLTAGGYREQVPDSDDFSSAFIAGISGDADFNGDKIVTANELGPFIRNALIPLGNQHPQFGTDTRFDMKLGDMVFVPNGPQTVAYASENPGPRNSALRSLGEPLPEASDAFKGIEVLYYRKPEDRRRVSESFDRNKIPYVVTAAELSGKFPVNTIACAPDVPIEAIKQVALTLLDSGVPVKRMMTFRKPAEKPRRIEILSSTRDGAGKVDLDSVPLSRKQIEELTSCPSMIENSLPG